jgi:hypothetical protein
MGNIIYTMPLTFNPAIYNLTRFTVDGFDFTITTYVNKHDNQICMDLYNHTEEYYLFQGTKCIPNITMCSERDYAKSGYYGFAFIRKDRTFGVDNITPETLNDYDFVMVVFNE